MADERKLDVEGLILALHRTGGIRDGARTPVIVDFKGSRFTISDVILVSEKGISHGGGYMEGISVVLEVKAIA